MRKRLSITCDCCGKEIYGKNYLTLNVKKTANDNQQRYPAIYLCETCFRDTKLNLLLGNSILSKKGEE